jgi:hypothetical protein
MPGSADIALGNIAYSTLLQATLSPVSVANATSAEQTFTLNGVVLGDVVTVTKPTAQAGLGIVGSRVSANNVLAITFINTTAATITPTASQVYLIHLLRRENPGQNLPTAFV